MVRRENETGFLWHESSYNPGMQVNQSTKAGERTQIAKPNLYRYINGGTTVRKYRTTDLAPMAKVGQRYLQAIDG